MAETSAVSMGMVFLVGGVITLYLWIASFREPPGFSLTLLFLCIAYLLLAVSLFTGLAIVRIVGGIALVISSVIAAIAFTDLYRRAGLGEVPMVDELVRKARERLAEKNSTLPGRLGLPRRHNTGCARAGVFRSSLRGQLRCAHELC